MVQAELTNSTFKTGSFFNTDKKYTMTDIEEMMNLIESSNQITLHTWKLGTCNNNTEYEWVKRAVLDACNTPEKFDSPGDTLGAIINLRKMIKKNNCNVLRGRYGMTPKYEYRNQYLHNFIVDANNHDEIIIPLTAREILDIIADLNKGHSISKIYDSYLEDFHHDTVTMEHLELLKKLYYKGELNKLIKFICSKSNELGGFVDYGVEVLRNCLTSQYIYDSRRVTK